MGEKIALVNVWSYCQDDIFFSRVLIEVSGTFKTEFSLEMAEIKNVWKIFQCLQV